MNRPEWIRWPGWLRLPEHTPRPGRDSAAVRAADKAVLWITFGATAGALSLSYRNQFLFATQRGGYPVWGGLIFPLLLDTFVVVGELRLFSATSRGDGWRVKAWAWLITAAGLAASAAAGIAHVGWHGTTDMRLAAAVAPLAAAACLGTGLGIVKLNARSSAATGARRRDGSQERAQAVATSSPRPAKATRARQPGIPGPETIARWLAEDRLAGKPMGRRSFWQRHADEGLTEHRAKMALQAESNGHGKVPVG